MGPRGCSGFAQEDGPTEECCFNPRDGGKKAQGKFEGKCMWCSPARLETVCMDARQRKLAARLLATLREQDVAVFDMATRRLSTHEGGDDVIARANVILSNRQQAEDDSPAEGHLFAPRQSASRRSGQGSRRRDGSYRASALSRDRRSESAPLSASSCLRTRFQLSKAFDSG